MRVMECTHVLGHTLGQYNLYCASSVKIYKIAELAGKSYNYSYLGDVVSREVRDKSNYEIGSVTS